MIPCTDDTCGESSHCSIPAKCLRILPGLFSPNLTDQSSCRILTTHAKTRHILHDDLSVRLGENRPDSGLKHLAAMLVTVGLWKISIKLLSNLIIQSESYQQEISAFAVRQLYKIISF